MTNLLTGDNTNFATSIGTWTSAQSGANFTSSWSSADQKLRLDVTVGGTNIAMAHTGTGATDKPAVTPGQTLTLSAKVSQPAGATLRTVRLEGHFFDASNVALASGAAVIATGSSVPATVAEQTISGTVTVPAGAAFVRALFRIITPGAGDAFKWDDVVLDDGSVPPPPAGDTVVDRWDGAALVRQRIDRWSGSALVLQRLDGSGVAAAPSPQPLANAVHVTIGGEDYTAQSPGQPYSLAVVGDPSSPTYSRHELHNGDRWVNDVNNFPNDARERCELRGNTFLPMEVDVWMSGSVRVTASTWKPNEYNIITQFIQDPPSGEAGGQNSLNFSIENGILQIYTRGDTAAVTTVRPAAVTRYTTDWTPHLGQWVSLVVRARFSKASANGELDVWLDGSKVIGATGIVMGFNNPQGPYSKLGVYRSGWTDPIVVEWANREIGTASLLSRVTSPLPTPA